MPLKRTITLDAPPGYRGGWCIHFQDASRFDVCQAGVRYDVFTPGRWPCFLDEGQPRPGKQPCASLRCPTAEEMAARAAWMTARLEKMATVGTVVAKWREQHRGRNHAEVIECPACQGQLQLSIVAYNSHVHGRCATPGCVRWTE